MKHLINIAFFAVFAPAAMCATALMPADSAICISYSQGNNMADTCKAGAQLYMDQAGRCGCLTTEEFMQPEICQVAYINCDAAEGQTFSSLFQYRNMCGMMDKVYAGCGCYADVATAMAR